MKWNMWGITEEGATNQKARLPKKPKDRNESRLEYRRKEIWAMYMGLGDNTKKRGKVRERPGKANEWRRRRRLAQRLGQGPRRTRKNRRNQLFEDRRTGKKKKKIGEERKPTQEEHQPPATSSTTSDCPGLQEYPIKDATR